MQAASTRCPGAAGERGVRVNGGSPITQLATPELTDDDSSEDEKAKCIGVRAHGWWMLDAETGHRVQARQQPHGVVPPGGYSARVLRELQAMAEQQEAARDRAFHHELMHQRMQHRRLQDRESLQYAATTSSVVAELPAPSLPDPSSPQRPLGSPCVTAPHQQPPSPPLATVWADLVIERVAVGRCATHGLMSRMWTALRRD